jgi:hypothetical protein
MIDLLKNIADASSGEAGDNLDETHDGGIEGVQITGRYPVFAMRSATGLLDIVSFDEALFDLETSHVA